MKISDIIAEADLLVPNAIQTADKVIHLNSLNGDFFNVVKIPKLAQFNGVAGQASYTLPSDVRQKNIDLVQVGVLTYLDLLSSDVNPVQNAWAFDDSTGSLALSPAPYRAGIPCKARYRRIATTTFVSSNLNAVPDAPEEYHWTFVPALCAFYASQQDDFGKAANYEAQYRAAWNTAAQDFARGLTP